LCVKRNNKMNCRLTQYINSFSNSTKGADLPTSRNPSGFIRLVSVLFCILFVFAPNVTKAETTTKPSLSFAEDPLNGKSTLVVALDGKLAGRLIEEKRMGEIIRFTYRITNRLDSEAEVRPIRILLGSGLQSETDEGAGFGSGFYEVINPFISLEQSKQVSRIDNVWLDEFDYSSKIQWSGWVNRYHIEAIRLAQGVPGWHLNFSGPKDGELNPQNLKIQLTPDVGSLAKGESLIFQIDYLSVPKKRALLKDPKIELEGVLLMNLWNWFRSICFMVWALIQFLFSLSGSWGLSLILLALVIRILTFPITRFSIKFQETAMQQQARVAPLQKVIKEKYSGIEQSEKIIEMYETQNYDHLAPFKSMLGLFIQIPIFAALFNVLGEIWEMSGVHFLWISDLSRSDRLFGWGIDIPYFGSYFNLLPVLMAVITILSTWLAAKHSGNNNSPTITLFGMGGLFFVLFYSFPAALVLYWMSSNLFQLIQQSVENYLNSRTMTNQGE